MVASGKGKGKENYGCYDEARHATRAVPKENKGATKRHSAGIGGYPGSGRMVGEHFIPSRWQSPVDKVDTRQANQRPTFIIIPARFSLLSTLRTWQHTQSSGRTKQQLYISQLDGATH